MSCCHRCLCSAPAPVRRPTPCAKEPRAPAAHALPGFAAPRSSADQTTLKTCARTKTEQRKTKGEAQNRFKINRPEGKRREGPPFPANPWYKVSNFHHKILTLGEKREEERKRRRTPGRGSRSSVRAPGESIKTGSEKGRRGERVFNPNNSQPKRLNYP